MNIKVIGTGCEKCDALYKMSKTQSKNWILMRKSKRWKT